MNSASCNMHGMVLLIGDSECPLCGKQLKDIIQEKKNREKPLAEKIFDGEEEGCST